jgi:RimJ/RimL family protein N-acetyltransferase
MGKNDLQVGDTWTRPGYRGQGLATFAIHKIVEKLRRADRAFWYVVQEDNTSSIRVVEKAGFKLIGKGVKTKRMGLSLFGSYIIKENLVNRFEI